MPNFHVLNQSLADIIGFHRSHHANQAFVQFCEIRCYNKDILTSKFEKIITRLLPTPLQFVFSAFDARVGIHYHSAMWSTGKSLQPEKDDHAMLQWYHLMASAVYGLEESTTCDGDFEVMLVAFDQKDVLQTRPYYLHPIPSFHNCWGAQEATLTTKIDSFEGTLFKDVHESFRQIWIDFIKKQLEYRSPKPVLVKEMEDYLEVTWSFQGDEETNDMLRSVFWIPGQQDKIPNDFKCFYDLRTKQDFLDQLTILQDKPKVGESNA